MTPFTPSPNDTDGMTALRNFILAVLPAGVQVVQGQTNRTPEPDVTEFVVMTPIHRKRLATNIDSYSDARFIGSIAGNALTVSSVSIGTVQVGATLYGPTVLAGTTITGGPNTGGPGSYAVSLAQTVASSILSGGTAPVLQETQIAIQLYVHSADLATAGNMAQTIVTLLRSDFGVNQFASFNPSIAPLYAEEPRQLPFINAEQEYESRWVVETILQMQQVLNIPEQFADSATLTVIDVEAAYGP